MPARKQPSGRGSSQGAGAFVLGSAMFAGMARRIAPQVGGPIVDPMRAAVLQTTIFAGLTRPATP